MSKPTPGPWTWNGIEAIHAKNEFGDNDIICLMATEDPDSVYARDEEESRANARLIAAAPELLALLVSLEVYIDSSGELNVPGGLVAERIRAAIAKATGQ